MSDFPFLHFVDAIYIINLDFRQDRREETLQELRLFGLDYEHPKVTLFHAIRPSSSNGFPNIGTRGCYLSHLNTLKDARSHGHRCILILEDDISFTSQFCKLIPAQITEIEQAQWDIFNIGSLYQPDCVHNFVTPAPPTAPFKDTHAILLKDSAITRLVPYLEAMLTRNQGDPLGGPMHVDGAYNWFRKDNPHINTLVATPALAVQRASKTDIHDTGWKEYIPFINIARRLKNKLKVR